MLFRSNHIPTRSERLRLAFWPRRSFGRSLRYYGKRALRLRATPHAIAAGVASGIAMSFVPVPGVHFILAAALAWCIWGNVFASAIGTALGNPLTLPFLWSADFEVGRVLLDGSTENATAPGMDIGALIHHGNLAQLWEPLLKPTLLGSVPLGLVAGVMAYALTHWTVSAFQTGRRARLEGRHLGGAAPAPVSVQR